MSPEEMEDAGVAAWTVVLADERIVPLDDDDSNFRLVREALPGIPREAVLPVDVARAPAEAAAEYEERVRAALDASGGGHDGLCGDRHDDLGARRRSYDRTTLCLAVE